MLSQQQLCKRLGITPKRLRRWISAGMPVASGKKKIKQFGLDAVVAWMLEHGKLVRSATTATPGQVATTRDEAARLLQVSTRTVAEWLGDPTFPGKAGSPGRQDGYFPIDQIESWRAARHGTDGRSNALANRVAEARARSLETKADRDRIELEKEQGSLLDAEDVAHLVDRQIAMARAVLDELPDRIEAKLPQGIQPKIKKLLRTVIEQAIDQTYDALSEMKADEDPDQAEES